MSFKTELKLKGVNLPDKEIERLKDIAINEARTTLVDKVEKMNEHGFYSVLIMVTALSKSLNELMLGVSQKNLRYKLKQDFKNLLNLTGRLPREFEKANKQDELLMKGFDIYTSEFNELIYTHLDTIKKNTEK